MYIIIIKENVADIMLLNDIVGFDESDFSTDVWVQTNYGKDAKHFICDYLNIEV